MHPCAITLTFAVRRLSLEWAARKVPCIVRPRASAAWH
jgi:hypothetical protein